MILEWSKLEKMSVEVLCVLSECVSCVLWISSGIVVVVSEKGDEDCIFVNGDVGIIAVVGERITRNGRYI
ncbi:hypothetical protein [Escherichia coli]|uniref:hypothetical protein n=1 Tax=Escherichia coli TaxID=562 RepID=UPI0030D25174